MTFVTPATAESTTWTDMETLAKQIEERMQGDWSMIREDDLERIWPRNEEDREEKIAQFAKKYGFRLKFYQNLTPRNCYFLQKPA